MQKTTNDPDVQHLVMRNNKPETAVQLCVQTFVNHWMF